MDTPHADSLAVIESGLNLQRQRFEQMGVT